MDRALDRQEKGKVRTARADFFKILKRKEPNPQNTSPITTSQPNSSISSKRLKSPDMVSSKASSTPLIIRFYDYDVQATDAHGRTREEILSWSDSQLERCHNYIQMLFPLPEGSPFNWEAPVVDREVMVAFRSRSELRNRLRKSFERMLEFYGFTTSTRPKAEENAEKNEKADTKAEVEKNAETVHSEEGTTLQGTSNTEIPTTDPDAAKASNNKNNPVGEVLEASAAKSTTTSACPPGSHSQSNKIFSMSYYVVRSSNFHKNSRNWAVRVDHNHLRTTRILRCLRVLGLQKECDAFFEALKRVFDDPAIRISDTSMMYWQRAVTRPLYIAPDGDKCDWLKKWEDDQKVQQEVKAESSKVAAGERDE